MNYEIVSEVMWAFLVGKYGCDFEVRRFYGKGSYSYYT